VLSGELIDVVVWLFIIELLSFAVLPFVTLSFCTESESHKHLSEGLKYSTTDPSQSRVVVAALQSRYSNDFGYGASKVLGILIFGLFTWLPAALGIVEVSRNWVTLCFLGILVSGAYRWMNSSREKLALLKKLLWKNLFLVEGLFLSLTCFFLLIRFLNPEIFWGEKPMDSTFLHFFTRNESIPPQDPWGAGHTMSYYYLGIYFLGVMLKLSGIPVSIGYNLAIATLAGLIGTALYSLFMQLTSNRATALLGAIGIVLASDPEVLRLTIFEGKTPNFDTFWASTRVLTSPHFYEYTSWSLLFADLHAHVISIPFTVVLLTLSVVVCKGSTVRYTKSGLGVRILLGAVLGAIYAVNTWDVLTFGAVAGLLVFFTPCRPFWDPPTRPDGSIRLAERVFALGFARVIALAWDGLVIGTTALLIAVPYSLESGAKNRIHKGWATVGEFNEVGQIILMIGYWFALIILAAVIMASIAEQPLRKLISRLVVGLLFTGFLFLLPLFNPTTQVSEHPWAVIALGALFAGLFFALVIVKSRRFGEQDVPVCLIGISAAVLIVLLEEFFLIDRMNSIFKGYMAVWMLFAIVAVYLTHRLFKTLSIAGDRKAVLIASLPVAVLFVASSIGTALNCLAVVDLQRVPVRTRTLDGAAYLDAISSGDALAISWLNHFVRKTPTIVEAWGPSYREYSRISMHTGLPALVGWEHHVQQRGLPHYDFEERRDAVRSIYTSTDLLLTKMLLLKYRVEFVVVGDIERKSYGSKGLQKFFDHPELFRPVISSGGTTLFVPYYSEFFQKLTSSTR
jgi:YYY domain-containing protein